jgi:uncharacterized protein
MKIIRFADLVATPWKNGGGVTREVAAYPEGAGFDAFGWRVSIADVAGDGPFSTFENVDRTLVLIDGTGLELTIDGTKSTLDSPGDRVSFAGEAAVSSHLGHGKIRDFNVMTRRGVFLHHVEMREGSGFHAESTGSEFESGLAVNLLFLLENQNVATNGSAKGLQRHDMIVVEAGDFDLWHSGRALHLRINPAAL